MSKSVVSLAVGANIGPYIAQSTGRGENLINSRTDMSVASDTVEHEADMDVRSKRELWSGLQLYRYRIGDDQVRRTSVR